MFADEGDVGVESRKTHVFLYYLRVVFTSTSCMFDRFYRLR